MGTDWDLPLANLGRKEEDFETLAEDLVFVAESSVGVVAIVRDQSVDLEAEDAVEMELLAELLESVEVQDLVSLRAGFVVEPMVDLSSLEVLAAVAVKLGTKLPDLEGKAAVAVKLGTKLPKFEVKAAVAVNSVTKLPDLEVKAAGPIGCLVVVPCSAEGQQQDLPWPSELAALLARRDQPRIQSWTGRNLDLGVADLWAEDPEEHLHLLPATAGSRLHRRCFHQNQWLLNQWYTLQETPLLPA